MAVRENDQIKSGVPKTAARPAEEKFRLVFDAAPSAMMTVNDRGLMTLVNPPKETLFRHQRKELPQEPIEMLVPERCRPAHPDHCHRFFQTATTRPLGVQFDQFFEATKQLGMYWLVLNEAPPLET